MPRPRTAPPDLVSTNLRIRQDLLDRVDAEAEARDLGRAPLVNILIERGLQALQPHAASPKLPRAHEIVPASGPGQPSTGKTRPRLADIGASFAANGPRPPMTGPAGKVRQAAAPPPEPGVVFDPPAEPPEGLQHTEDPTDLALAIAERQEELHAHVPAEGAPSVCSWCQGAEDDDQHAIHAELAKLGFEPGDIEVMLVTCLEEDLSVEGVLDALAELAKPTPPPKATPAKKTAKKASKATKKTSSKKAPAKRGKPKS